MWARGQSLGVRFLTAASGTGGEGCHTGPMTPPRIAACAVAVVAGLMLGGCHSGSRSASSAAGGRTETSAEPRVTAPSGLAGGADGTGPSGGAAGPPCTVATAALVSSKLGFSLTGPNLDRGPAATICTYDNPSDRAQSATVQITSGATPAGFAQTRKGFAGHGESVTDIPGLGDEAYSATLTMANVTNTTLVARKGSTEVLVTTTAPADRVPALMTAVLALV